MATDPNAVITQYQEAIDNARVAYENASKQAQFLQSQLDAIPEPDDVSPGSPGEAALARRKALQQQLDTAMKAYESAQSQYTTTLRQRADAVTKAQGDADPATQARLEAQARADTARANQIEAEVKTSAEEAPDKKAQSAANTRLLNAKADQADLELRQTQETDPQRKAALQAQIDSSRAATARAEAETAQIGKPAPQTPEQQRTAAAGATVAEAQASTAGDTAQANLQRAQADAARAQADLADVQRRARQAPTDEQAQQAIQQELNAAQQRSDQAQFTLDQAKQMAPTVQAQAQANLETTQAGLQKAKLGDLYGVQDRLKEIRDLLASGEIKPEEADQMSTALLRGTSVYDAMKQQQADVRERTGQQLSQRGQDVSSRNSLANDFTSMFTSGFNQIADMNKYAEPGSSAGAAAFKQLLGMAQSNLAQYAAPAPIDIPQAPDYLGGAMSGMIGQAQQAAMPPPPPQPSGGHTINISIGGTGGDSQPPPGPVQSLSPLQAGDVGYQPQPFQAPVEAGSQQAQDYTAMDAAARSGGLADMASDQVPVSLQDIIAHNPNAARRMGLVA